MSKRKALFIAVSIVLLPVQVFAAPAICLRDQFGNQHSLELLATSTLGFASLVGEVVFSPSFNDTASCPRALLTGAARMRSNGVVQIGYSSSSSTSECFPIVVQVFLTLPSLTVVGFFDEVNSGFSGDLTFTATSGLCAASQTAVQPQEP